MASVLKLIVAVVAGAIVASGLLFLMQALIASGQTAITEVSVTRVVDFVRVKREERLESKRAKPDRPPNPDQPPPEAPQPSMNESTSLGGDATAVEAAHNAPVPVADVDIAVSPGFGIAAGSADGDYLPIVKVAPIYPQRAIDRGIEGYVIVEFTVTKTGSVKNPRVVEFHPSTIFNKAAIDAALKFKYKPRIVNGEPIEVHGVLNKITFKLED
ncbi:MAG TPA: energy transducer TonB [Methylomirabilota bacterium]|nr:energy transducer TonB [Methylomirabilota bacterium]